MHSCKVGSVWFKRVKWYLNRPLRWFLWQLFYFCWLSGPCCVIFLPPCTFCQLVAKAFSSSVSPSMLNPAWIEASSPSSLWCSIKPSSMVKCVITGFFIQCTGLVKKHLFFSYGPIKQRFLIFADSLNSSANLHVFRDPSTHSMHILIRCLLLVSYPFDIFFNSHNVHCVLISFVQKVFHCILIKRKNYTLLLSNQHLHNRVKLCFTCNFSVLWAPQTQFQSLLLNLGGGSSFTDLDK